MGSEIGANGDDLHRSRMRWFFVPIDDARARRPVDVVTAVAGAFIILFTAVNADQIRWLEEMIGEFVALFPPWLESTLALIYVLGGLYTILIIVLAGVRGGRRLGLFRDLLVAGALVIGATSLLTRLVDGAWPVLMPEIVGQDGPLYPVLRVAFATAILVVAAPHLVRPLRWLNWLVLFLLALAATDLGYGLPNDVLGGFGVGLFVAGFVLIVFGSPRGVPQRADVQEAANSLGVDISDLSVPDRQAWGARQFEGISNAGAPVAVSVYGRDARDAQLASRWWRSVWYRDSGPALTTSRLHQVEHQALMTIEAGRAGVPTQDLLVAGEPSKREALIALSARGTLLSDLDDAGVSDDELTAMWRGVATLHAAEMAHGRLNMDAVRFDGGQPIFENFRKASIAAPDSRIQGDTVELLATTAERFGAERAVTVARRGLHDDQLVAALPYMQRAAVSHESRSDLPPGGGLFKELRNEIAAQTGTDLPKTVAMRRITARTILMFGLTLLAGYALIGMLAGIDYAAVWEELQDADWAWILVGFILAELTLFADASSMMAAVAQPIPMKPTVLLESAIKFIQLAIGGAAGRLATNVTYLRKFGIPTTDAVTQGGVDSLTGFFIQAFIILAAILFGSADLIPDDASLDINWAMVLGLLLFAVVVSALMFRFIPAVRDHLVPPVKQMWDGLKMLAKDPGRLIRLFGSNLVSQLLFASALWVTAFAFGYTLPFVSVLLINTIASLFAGLLPIPGGVGVTEALLTAGLTAVGVDESAAFAIAVTFRIASSYLPPIWGWFSMRWLEKNEYL